MASLTSAATGGEMQFPQGRKWPGLGPSSSVGIQPTDPTLGAPLPAISHPNQRAESTQPRDRARRTAAKAMNEPMPSHSMAACPQPFIFGFIMSRPRHEITAERVIAGGWIATVDPREPFALGMRIRDAHEFRRTKPRFDFIRDFETVNGIGGRPIDDTLHELRVRTTYPLRETGLPPGLAIRVEVLEIPQIGLEGDVVRCVGEQRDYACRQQPLSCAYNEMKALEDVILKAQNVWMLLPEPAHRESRRILRCKLSGRNTIISHEIGYKLHQMIVHVHVRRV
ncbi:hypothetical protein NM208_g16086 [Fusarium decemcellulare]|uniref:Uncharacterized protein n=1 Tax=Fusarium decemcellulare TaxID=57161 RepID=A0ACC1RFE1_9HYPO|nr:hypothetical protein NM208_g16086 [Fusarium decemcellulare]